MKSILVLCLFIAIAGTVMVWRVAAKPSRFGNFTSAPKVEVVKLIAEPKAFVGKTVEIEGTVTKQCRLTGCFFFFQSGTDSLRVDIQAVAMKAPMKAGHMARVEGQIVPYGKGYQLYASAVEFE